MNFGNPDDEDEGDFGDAAQTDGDVMDMHEKIELLLNKEHHDTAKDYDGVALPSIEINVYQQILHASDAFARLLQNIKRDISLSGVEPVVMQSVRSTIMAAFHDFQTRISRWKKPKPYGMTFILNWDTRDFLKNEFDGESSLDQLSCVITLTGSERVLQALPCGEYMQQTWPSSGLLTLGLVQEALEDPHQQHNSMYIYPGALFQERGLGLLLI